MTLWEIKVLQEIIQTKVHLEKHFTEPMQNQGQDQHSLTWKKNIQLSAKIVEIIEPSLFNTLILKILCAQLVNIFKPTETLMMLDLEPIFFQVKNMDKSQAANTRCQALLILEE